MLFAFSEFSRDDCERADEPTQPMTGGRLRMRPRSFDDFETAAWGEINPESFPSLGRLEQTLAIQAESRDGAVDDGADEGEAAPESD